MISRYSHAVDLQKKGMQKMGSLPHRQQYEARRALKCACCESKAFRQDGAGRK